MPENDIVVAIVDYGLGNLYSVRQACSIAGLDTLVTSDKAEISMADAVILPGVGAFKQAMETLFRLDLVSVLRDVAGSGKPLIGICLGLQLLMSESHEFGYHQGLGIIHGTVQPFESPKEGGRVLKVPQIGWNRVHLPDHKECWAGSFLDGIPSGAYMYFVHSYIAKPNEPGVNLGRTVYGNVDFCSAIQHGNVSAFQFHPERSGPQGINMYRNLAIQLHGSKEGRST